MSDSGAPGVQRAGDSRQPLPGGRYAIAPAAISYVGVDLARPECILAERDGSLVIADRRATFTLRLPDGSQHFVGNMRALPNGMAIDRTGDLWVANIGDCLLYRVNMQTGDAEVMLSRFEGRPLGSVNFVYVDGLDRLWVTVSTRTEPRLKALTDPVADGYVLCIENGTPRLAMDGLYFTNEVRTDREETTLYVAETTAGRVSRCRIGPDGRLGPRETFGPDPLYPGARVDGIAFDMDGNLWVTELTRNALVVIEPQGDAFIAIENLDGHLFEAPSSLTFGGPDLRTAYIGSLSMNRIATFRAEVAGVALRHWDRPTTNEFHIGSHR